MQRTPTSHEEPSQATPWRIVIIVILVGALTRVLFGAFARQESPPAKPTTLTVELPPMRLTEGRLSWYTGHAIYPTRPDRRSLLALGLRQAPTSLNDRVLYHLLADNLDQAVADMEEGVRTTPGQALLLSDLSALYGERARAKDRPEDYIAALEMAERAVAIGPDVAEANFNYALALERLFLYDKAQEAWDRPMMDFFPESNSLSSGWRDEAREHWTKVFAEAHLSAEEIHYPLLQRIAKGDEKAISRLTAENPGEAREFFEATLLPKWAEAVAHGQSDQASLQLTGARAIGKTLAGRGERIFLRIVDEMATVAAHPDLREAAMLVQSLRRIGRGREKLRSDNCADAMRDLEVAEQDLHSIGSAAEAIVSLLKSHCQLRQKKFLEAQATLDRLGRVSLLTDCPSLEAWRQSYLASVASHADDVDGALAAARRAYDLFHTSGEVPSAAYMQNEVANVLDSLGQRTEAWRYRYRALAWTCRLPGDRDQLTYRAREQLSIASNIFEGAAQASLAQRRPEAALQLQSRAVSIAQALGQPEKTALALLTRARVEAALGRQEAAKRDFQGALSLLPTRQNWASELLAARIDVVRSEVADAEGRAAAIASEHFAPEYLDEQADADFRRGDTAAAEKSLERRLDDLERHREKVVPGAYRVSYFDQARPLYDRMIALQVHLAQPEKALEVLERFRARALRDQIREVPGGSIGDSPLGWRDLCRQVPERTVLSIYAVVEGRLITWLVRRSGIRMSPYQSNWSIVSSWAQSVREPQVKEAERKKLLEHLYNKLVAPWEKDLRHDERIIFVPTEDLYGVSFAALLNPASGKFLIEEHTIGVAPSISEFVTAVERDRWISAKPLTSILLVGDPVRLDADRIPSLPGSAQEIRLVSHLYHRLDTQVLTRAEATPGRVLAALDGTDIAHFAVHALQNFEDPTLSRLLLSSSRSTPGELSARDLLTVRFSRTRLVVLAACGTHVGPISESEGSLSLSRSFLAAGVPAVVGSLGGVVDESTARLSVRFHRELLRGADALTALRVAQREEISTHRSLSDWTWASFQVYGGVEERDP